jgi:hypothetical protein
MSTKSVLSPRLSAILVSYRANKWPHPWTAFVCYCRHRDFPSWTTTGRKQPRSVGLLPQDTPPSSDLDSHGKHHWFLDPPKSPRASHRVRSLVHQPQARPQKFLTWHETGLDARAVHQCSLHRSSTPGRPSPREWMPKPCSGDKWLASLTL